MCLRITMLQKKIDRRNFLKVGAGAVGSGLALSSSCAFLAPYEIPIPTKRVFVCSDIHIGYIEDDLDGDVWFDRALSDLKTIGPIDYGLALGDIAHNGMSEEMQKYVAIRGTSHISTWYELAGNHEYFNGEIESFYNIVNPGKTYMVVDGNLVWFFLSDEVAGPEGNFSDKTFVWFIDMLAKNQDKIIIVCTHQCVYGTVRDSTNSNRHIYPVEMIAEILNRFRIDLWLCGHQHYYPYSSEDMYYDGTTWFINVSSMHHGYSTKMSQSVILDFHQGTKEITAYHRSHDMGQFDTAFTVTVPVPFPIQLSKLHTVTKAFI